MPFARLGATRAVCGAGCGLKRWTAFQIRVTPLVRFVNFITGFKSSKGVTSARLFQVSARVLRGHSEEFLLGGKAPGVLRQMGRALVRRDVQGRVNRISRHLV